jgi:hypothetical protein
MTLKKLLKILAYIEGAYASVQDVSMHGSHMYANSGGELTISFNTQPPQSLDELLRREGFIVWDGEYIYRPRVRTKAPTTAMIRNATLRIAP